MNDNDWLSYEEALGEVAKRRASKFLFPIIPTKPTHPNTDLDPITQTKIKMVGMLMLSIGRGPGDMPINQTINYRILRHHSLNFLMNNLKINAMRPFAPFQADYVAIFRGGEVLLNPKAKGRFYGQLVHIFVNESQLVVNEQYYLGLKLNSELIPISLLSEAFTDEEVNSFRLSDLSKLDMSDLHGRIFLEYHTIMIRAQWDKLIRLMCMAFDLKDNWNSIDDGIDLLEKQIHDHKEWTSQHLQIFVHIANTRLDKNGWLRPFRDSLLHKTGQHSAGILPQKKSVEHTYQLWKKAKQEHNWWREAMMVAILIMATAKFDRRIV